MDICQITLITLNQKFLLVAPDTLSETLLCTQYAVPNYWARICEIHIALSSYQSHKW